MLKTTANTYTVSFHSSLLEKTMHFCRAFQPHLASFWSFHQPKMCSESQVASLVTAGNSASHSKWNHLVSSQKITCIQFKKSFTQLLGSHHSIMGSQSMHLMLPSSTFPFVAKSQMNIRGQTRLLSDRKPHVVAHDNLSWAPHYALVKGTL